MDKSFTDGIRILRHSVILLVLCAMALPAMAQSAKITLRMSDATLGQVIRELEQQTQYVFLNKNVDMDKGIDIVLKDATINEALSSLFADSDVSYDIQEKHVILSLKDGKSVDNERVVFGKVLDVNKLPIAGAYVMVQGTSIGTSTDATGHFSLPIPFSVADPILEIGFIGYETIKIHVGERANFEFTLLEQAIEMDALVVTALGIKRSEKALSYNVQQVQGENLITIKDANFINSLNGKVAGLTINASSSGIGGESKVVMRGTKGISQSSNALYVIDGIPMYSSESYGSTGMGSRGRSEAIADINSEDIESISVLTGAAAAALYGSQASNGAIVITTKSGKSGKMELTVSSNTTVMTPLMMYDFQNRYGNEAGSVYSWGGRLTETNSWGYEPARDFLQTSVVGMESVSLSVGNDRNQTYLSAAATDSKGVVPNNGYHRYNFTLRNTTSFLNDRLHLDLGAQYIREKDRNMINQGEYSNPLVAAYLYPRGEDWDYARVYEKYDSERKIMTQNWEWMSQGGLAWDNPYWTAYRQIRENSKSRYMLNAGLTWDILDWLKLSGRIRVDNTENKYTSKLSSSTNTTITEGSRNGYYEIEKTENRQLYGDVILSVDKKFNADWSLNANIGASFSDVSNDLLQNRGPIRSDGLPNVFNVFQLDNSQTIRRQDGYHDQTQSVFASAEVGYKGAYYLTVTARNDWPSQLAGPHSVKSSFFYPSVGGSIVFSEIFNMPDMLEYLKLRSSYASVGLPFRRFLANPTYAWNTSTGTWEIEKIYPIYDLNPERTNSWEVGLTMRFLRNFSLDVSYYNARTFNQTFDTQLSVSSGYTTLYVQTGNVLNDGVELQLGYDNSWGRFSWSSSYTFSANRNRLVELMDNYTHPQTGATITLDELKVGGIGNLAFVLRPGGSLGDIYSTADLVRDGKGNVLISRDGKVSGTTGSYKKLGSVFPKANMAWNNEFAFGNLNLGFTVSARIGGVVYSATQAYLDLFGVSEATAAARDAGGVMIEGSMVNAQNWYSVVGADKGIPQYYTYDATNVRLSDIHIGYTVPRKKLGNLFDLNISVVAKNLLMIYCKAPFDPETVASADSYYQGIDYFMMPSLRSAGLNIRLKF